ncbi:MAG: hypothetical protein HY289_13290 [Planctomycetes bacterium]|nr:hypothetical protein [Planctomycetota bacterium]
MEHLDKLIALAILGGVAALVVFALRRVIREESESQPVERVDLRLAATPQACAEEAPPAVVPPAPIAPEPTVVVVSPPERKRKRREAPAPLPAKPVASTPIVTVFDLLKKKDAVAAAFLLREILAPPVSKRH